MKTSRIIIALAAAALLASSCIKETFPTDAATTEQLASSSSALAASVNGIPAQLVQGYLIYGTQTYEYDMAYPGIMLALDQCAGEIIDNSEDGGGYDWYTFWSGYANYSLGPTTARSYVPWRGFYMFIKSANDVIGALADESNASELQLQYKGMAYAYRAWQYLNLARIYEYKAPTDPAVKGSYKPEGDIAGLTVPIVTESTTLEESKNNPRVKVEDLYKFIFDDLDKAETLLANYTEQNPLFPSLGVVYGLKARAYLERGTAGEAGAYAKAAEYADKAIAASGCTPLTQTQWEDPTTGFNSAASNNSWMWALRYSAETMGNLCNFVNHIGAECTWSSYSWAPCRGIINSLYNTIPNSDWRKHSWIDPAGKDFYAYKTNRDIFNPDDKPLEPYTAIKFRPANGDYATYNVGGATDVPLMRVEEMHLIKAEGLVMSGSVSEGVAALEDIIKTRDSKYTCTMTDPQKIQMEIFRHKRIEFWGEGIIFFDAKRLAAGQKNGYEGTNAFAGQRFNCSGVCPWWNWVIPQSELEGNPVLMGYNNPDPLQSVDEWTE